MSSAPTPTASEALETLVKRNASFVADKLDGKLQDSRRREALTGGQNPFAIILSCADSRVVPELCFDSGLGELFVIRVAGNVANTSSVASIEYAVAHLNVQLIMVMGHQSCGAVTAALAGGDNGPNLNHLLGHISPATEGFGTDDVNGAVRANAKYAAAELSKRSTIISGAIEAGRLKVVPAYYALESGKVEVLD